MTTFNHNRWRLDRRAFLRGSGACLALPLLNAMNSSPLIAAGTKAARNTIPGRLLFVSSQLGFVREGWEPATTGRGFEFPSTLKSLEPFRDHVSILSGLAHPRAISIHGNSNYEFLTAAPAELKGGSIPYVQSLDQYAAARIGGDTRYNSLQLGTLSAKRSTQSQPLSYIDGAPLEPMRTPREIFERLFGAGDPAAAEQRRAEQRSILDSVMGRAGDLSKRLGKEDQAKLDQYLSSVRGVEKQIEREETWSKIPKPNPSLGRFQEKDFTGAEYNELSGTARVSRRNLDMYSELIALAFQTDLTRVLTHEILANTNPEDELGFPDEHHDLTHAGGIVGSRERWRQIDTLITNVFADLVMRLSETKEASGSLLDNTLILFGSPNGEGGHSVYDLPILLCGNIAGRVKHGQHLRFPGGTSRETPLSNLFATMLQVAGIETDSFRDSKKVISEIL